MGLSTGLAFEGEGVALAFDLPKASFLSFPGCSPSSSEPPTFVDALLFLRFDGGGPASELALARDGEDTRFADLGFCGLPEIEGSSRSMSEVGTCSWMF